MVYAYPSFKNSDIPNAPEGIGLHAFTSIDHFI